jgi:hypothetical protein
VQQHWRVSSTQRRNFFFILRRAQNFVDYPNAAN